MIFFDNECVAEMLFALVRSLSLENKENIAWIELFENLQEIRWVNF